MNVHTALLCAIFVTHTHTHTRTHTHTYTHMHAHTHARTHRDWLAVTLGSYFSHCFHKASCTSIYTLHICHTRTLIHTQTARTQTNTHKTHMHTQTHTQLDCMACTTCSDFWFLFLHCFHKVYIYINIHTCSHTALSCKQPTYSSHTHTTQTQHILMNTTRALLQVLSLVRSTHLQYT